MMALNLLQKRFSLPTGVASIAVLLVGCAPLPADSMARAEVEQLNDPFEPLNRQVYALNSDLNKGWEAVKTVGSPVAPLFRAIGNVLSNLRSPLVLVNDIAQAHGCAAETTFRRFMINSTIGIAGIFDPAKSYGLDAHDNDFGHTMAVWGLPSGPYLLVPVLGPTDVRGVAGTAVEFVADPVDIALSQAGAGSIIWPRAGLEALDRLSESSGDLNKLDRESLDGYAALRSAYRQNFEAELIDAACTGAVAVDPYQTVMSAPD